MGVTLVSTGGAPPRRAKLIVKVLYGAGDIGVALSVSAVGTYLLFYYTDIAGLSIGLAGLVSGIARVWDGIVDPPMGYLSDKTRTRFGRRRFWFGVAAIPLGVGVYVLFSPPSGIGTWGLFSWMLIGSLLASVFITMFLTPYYALGAELSDDPDERTQIVAIRLTFQFIGALAGGFMPVLALQYANVRQGYSHTAAAFGVLATLAILLAFFGTRERPVAATTKASFSDFWRGVTGSLSNHPFRILLLTFLAMSVAGGVSGAVSIYALIYWLGFTQREVGFLYPAILGAAALALPVWTYYSARVGKAQALTTLCLYLTVVYVAVFFLTSYQPIVWALMILQGFGIAGFMVASSLLADILDHDEFTTGEQRGGAFFGFWTFASKFGAGIAPPLVGGVLWWAGYVPNHPQSQFVLAVMRALYGPIPAFFFLVAAAIFQRFPLTRDDHLEIQTELRRRRAASLPNPPAEPASPIGT